MNTNKFDKHFRDHTQDHETPLNTDVLWEQIEPMVESEKKKSRKGFWFWFKGIGAILVLVTTSIIVIDNWGESKNTGENTNTTTSSVNISTENTSLPAPSTVSAEKSEKTSIQSNDGPGLPDTPPVSETKPSKPDNFLSTAKQENKASVKPRNFYPHQAIGHKNQSFQKENNTTSNSQKDHQKTRITEQSPLKQLNETNHFNTPLSTTEKLSLLYFTVNHVAPVEFPEANFSTYENTPEIDKTNRNSPGFSIGILSSPGLAFKMLNAKNNEDDSFATKRLDSEKSLEGIGLGVQFFAEHASGIWLSTGIQFHQINEQFNFFNQTRTVTSSGDAITIETHTIEKKIFNKYKMMDIPVIIGYNLRKRNWTFSAEAGILVNLNLKTNGQFYGYNAKFINIETDQDQIFKSNTGLSYQAAFGIEKSLNNYFSVSLKPQIRYFGKSFTLDTYPLEQKYIQAGLQIGLKYKLN